MIHSNFVFLGVALVLLGNVKYTLATIQGHVQPNRVTWLIWGIAPLISLVAAWADGATATAIISGGFALGSLMVFIASFFSQGQPFKLSALDYLCGILSVAAIAVWVGSGNATVALAFSVLINFTAAAPSIRKAWRAPETEHPLIFGFSLVCTILTFLAVDKYTLTTLAFPLSVFTVNIFMFSFVQFRLGTRFRSRKATSAVI